MDTLEAKFRVRVEGKEELEQFFAGGERGAKNFQSAVKAALTDTARGIAGYVSGLAKDLERVSGLKLGLAGNAKSALEFRDSLQRLVIMAQVGDDTIGGLKKQILDVAAASNQAAPAVVEALNAFVEKTGDIETARKNLALYATTATATAASLEDVAQVGVQLSDKLNVKDQAASFAVLAQQAKQGAIELKDLATNAPRIFSAGAALGLTGEKGVREAGALAQVYAKAFGGRGSGASVSTAIERTFSDLAAKSANVEALGVGVKGRDPMDVIFDIIKKTKGDPFAIADAHIFDSRAMRGIRILANEYKATGGFGTYESFRDVKPQGGLIASDAARAQSTGIAALQRSQNAIFRSSEENLGDAADALAHHSNIISGAYDAATAHPVAAAGAGIAGLFGLNLARRALFSGGGGLGGIGGLLGGAAGATPVTVTNWPSQFGGPGIGGAPGKAAKLGIGSIIPALGAGLAGYEFGKQLDEGGHLSDAIADVAQYATRGKKNLSDERARTVKGGIKAAFAGFFGGSEGLQKAVAAEVVNQIKIEINGDKATVTEGTGTRSTQAIVRRNGGG